MTVEVGNDFADHFDLDALTPQHPRLFVDRGRGGREILDRLGAVDAVGDQLRIASQKTEKRDVL
jgi:hypothetical protein